jgi:hypothetical protein
MQTGLRLLVARGYSLVGLQASDHDRHRCWGRLALKVWAAERVRSGC